MSTSIIAVLKKYVEAATAARIVRIARIEKAAAEQNNGLAPTIDRDGRAHAPCDGYFFSDGEIEGTYGAGEYLPTEHVDDDHLFAGGNGAARDYSKKIPSTRVKANMEVFRQMEILLEDFGKITHGKAWGTDRNVTYTSRVRCVIYIVLLRSITKQRQKNLTLNVKPIRGWLLKARCR